MAGSNPKHRAKNFTKGEERALVSATGRFRTVIDINSNRDVDNKAKNDAWISIKRGFDNYCHAEGIYVSC